MLQVPFSGNTFLSGRSCSVFPVTTREGHRLDQDLSVSSGPASGRLSPIITKLSTADILALLKAQGEKENTIHTLTTIFLAII